MSTASQIVLRYTTPFQTEAVVVVTKPDFEEVVVRAAGALGLDRDAVEIVYFDNEGDPVSICSQAELDEAVQQNDNNLVCRLTNKITQSSTAKIVKNRRPSSDRKAGRLRISMGTLVVLFAVIPCLVASVAVLIAVPKSNPTISDDACPNLMQQWATAIETELIGNESSAPSSVYDLLHVCPQDLALYWIGRYEYLLGNTCEALDRFTSSSRLNPSHAASHLWMGRCLDRLDRSVDALKAFAAAAHLAPYLAEAQYEYGRALSFPEVVSSAALAAATAAVSSNLNFDEARLLKGRLAYEKGDADSAYSEFSILAARYPDSAEYRIWKRRAFDDIFQDR